MSPGPERVEVEARLLPVWLREAVRADLEHGSGWGSRASLEWEREKSDKDSWIMEERNW